MQHSQHFGFDAKTCGTQGNEPIEVPRREPNAPFARLSAHLFPFFGCEPQAVSIFVENIRLILCVISSFPRQIAYHASWEVKSLRKELYFYHVDSEILQLYDTEGEVGM